jgi:predicted HTH transcriptional regulator
VLGCELLRGSGTSTQGRSRGPLFVYTEACARPGLPCSFLSVIELVELLRQHEGKTLEFKRDLSSPDKVVRTLVAFANSAGGVLLVGVEDDHPKRRVQQTPAWERRRRWRCLLGRSMSHQPNNIFAGTQVVALIEVRGTNNSLVHPRGAVGVVTRTPAVEVSASS